MSKRRRRLVGRQWAVTRIAEWYLSDEPALVITGSAGSGKTTLVTNLADTSAPLGRAVGAIHRCRAHLLTSTDPTRVLAGVAGQLAHRDRAYGETLAHLNWTERATRTADTVAFARSVVLDSMSPALAYDRALRRPFTSMASARDRTADTVVVIDGLDEAPPLLAGILSRSLRNPVPGLRMLLSARTPTAMEYLGDLPRLDLSADCPAGVDDLGAYLAMIPGLTAADRASAADLAGASYPHARLAAHLIRTGRAGGVTDHDGLVDAVIGSARDPDGRAGQLLSVLARSRDTGLSTRQLAWIVGLRPSLVTGYLDHFRHLLTPGPEMRLYHRCLADRVNALTPDVGAIDWMIAGALWRRWQTHGAAAGRYVLRYLLPHLADASAARDRYPTESALHGAVSDVEYLSALMDTIGVDDLVSTLADTVDRLAEPPVELSDLSTICRRQAPVLRSADSHAAVMTQLLYESATLGATAVARTLAARTPEQGVATLWATADSPLRLTLNPVRGHPSQIVSLAVTGDATRAFSVSADGTTRVWRLASGRVIHEKQTTEQVVALYVIPDTPQVVAATADGHAQLLDGDTGDPVGRVGEGKVATVTAFAVATGGTWGVSGDVDGNVTVWDVTAGEPMIRLTCGLDLITSVAVTPDGRRVAAASLSGEVIVWDLVLGLRLPTVHYPGAVNALALTTDGGRVLLGGDELVVHDLTDPAVPEVVRLVPNDWVTALAVNPMMPTYALIGTAFGQVAYVRLPARTGRRDLWPTM